jgi:hypothetical protein
VIDGLRAGTPPPSVPPRTPRHGCGWSAAYPAWLLSLLLPWQAELYTGAIDCIDHGSKRAGEEGVAAPGSLASPTPLTRRSDVLLGQANAVLTNALDGYEVPTESVGAPCNELSAACSHMHVHTSSVTAYL